MDIQCQIRTDESPDFLRLQAIARSDIPASGTYRLQVVKRSANGSSQNMQSGSISLEPGRDEILSTVILDASARNAYTARLDIEWAQGTRTCIVP